MDLRPEEHAEVRQFVFWMLAEFCAEYRLPFDLMIGPIRNIYPASVAGGRGSISGTVVGVLLLHELRQFISWRWYHEEFVLPVVGVVLIASVLAGRLLGDRSAEHA